MLEKVELHEGLYNETRISDKAADQCRPARVLFLPAGLDDIARLERELAMVSRRRDIDPN